MNHPLRRSLLTAGAALLATPLLGRAQSNWPSKPIRVVSAGSPGGSSDVYVRIIENRMRERLGQPFVLDNKPGAGGMTAAGIVSNAPSDGHTLFISNLATNAIGLHLYKKPSFDPSKDLPAVARIATMSNAVAVRADAGFQNLQQLIAALKSGKARPFYGSAGVGTSSQLTGHMMGKAMGMELNHVPYKGTAANLNALLAGEITFSADNLPLYLPHVKAGTLKVLAVTQAKRLDTHPELPTVMESTGWTGFDIYSWYGLSASTGTPPDILERLGNEVVATLKEPAIADKIRDTGADPAGLGHLAYRDFIQQEIRKWQSIVVSSGASAD